MRPPCALKYACYVTQTILSVCPMSTILENYRLRLQAETGLTFPRFAPDSSHEARILLVAETPGGSGAVKSGICAPTNDDPTARRTLRCMRGAGVSAREVVFWNFYAAYEPQKPSSDEQWARRLEALIAIMPKLRTILVMGDKAWHGVRYVRVPRHVELIWAPHPSARSINPRPEREALIVEAWQRAAAST